MTSSLAVSGLPPPRISASADAEKKASAPEWLRRSQIRSVPTQGATAERRRNWKIKEFAAWSPAAGGGNWPGSFGEASPEPRPSRADAAAAGAARLTPRRPTFSKRSSGKTSHERISSDTRVDLRRPPPPRALIRSTVNLCDLVFCERFLRAR